MSECYQGFQGFQNSEAQSSAIKHQAKKDKVEIKPLKKDLRYKEKALAETVALLVLRKKLKGVLGGQRRGELTPLPEHIATVALIHQPIHSGARLRQACEEAELSLRTYLRWCRTGWIGGPWPVGPCPPIKSVNRKRI
jgi:hypothetical protein